jgi:hypothetical protein
MSMQHENEARDDGDGDGDGDSDGDGDDADGYGGGYGYAGEVAKVRMDARVVSVLCAAGYSTLSLDSGASALLRTTLHLDN